MGTDATIDARTQAALARLTDNEKECLRRRLRQQTAKEMALELGVSPHAVEKRLKMARAKLGLSSSLEAARLLAASEGYQRAGPYASDLAHGAVRHQRPSNGVWLAGGILMSLVMAAALTIALQSSGGAPHGPGQDDQDAPTTLEMIETVVAQNFAAMDQDSSGFLDAHEASALGASPGFIGGADKNADGKLDLAEYRGWLTPILEDRGAEGRTLVEDYFARAGDRTLQPGHVPASPPEISAIVESTFRHLDADRSGFLDGEESALHAASGPQPVYRRDEDGKVVPTGDTIEQSEEEVRATFYSQADKDGDRKVSFEEFFQWSAPRLARQGIPADWQRNMNRPIQPGG